MEDEIMNVCKSQYKNVDFGLNNFVGFLTFLFYPLQILRVLITTSKQSNGWR